MGKDKKNKSIRKVASEDEKLRWMYLLDKNSGNVSKTAKEIDVTRVTLIRARNNFWDRYVASKGKTTDKIREIEAMKLSIDEDLRSAKSRIKEVLDSALDRAALILSDPELVKDLSNRDLIQLINVLAPYIAEKMGILGVDNNDEPVKKHTSVVQTIIQHMNNNINYDGNK